MIVLVHVPDLKSYRENPTQVLDRSRPCSRCGRVLVRHGTRPRWLYTAAEQIRLLLCRLRCKPCRITVTLLPDVLLPRRRYHADLIQRGVTGYVTTPDSYRRIAVELSGITLPDDQSATDLLNSIPISPSFQRLHAWVHRVALEAAPQTSAIGNWLLRLRPDSHFFHLLASPLPTFNAKSPFEAKRRMLADAALLQTLVAGTPELLSPQHPSSWLTLLHHLLLGIKEAATRRSPPSRHGRPPDS